MKAPDWLDEKALVFPCSAKKKPLTEHGFHDAKRVPEWGDLDAPLWGLVPASIGMAVIDVDVKEGKLGGWNLLELFGPERCAELFDTAHVYTRTGGGHFFYETKEQLGNAFDLEGVDLRCAEGYVILYGVPEGEVKALPPELRELCREKTKPKEAVEVRRDDPENDARVHSQVLQLAAQYLPAIESQDGSGTFFAFCCTMFREFRPSRGLAEEAAEIYSDRCLPPWSGKEIAHKLDDAERETSGQAPNRILLWSPAGVEKWLSKRSSFPDVQPYEEKPYNPPGAGLAEAIQDTEIGAWAQRVVDRQAWETRQQAKEIPDETAEPAEPEDPFEIALISPKAIVELAAKVAPLLVPPLIPVGAYVYAAAPTGIGKSWFGYFVAFEARRLGVPLIYVAAEDKSFDLKWRMLQTAHGNDERGWLWHHPNFRLDDDQWVDALISRMQTNGTKLLVLDPLRRLHRAKENLSDYDGGMGHALHSIWRIITETGATVFVIHHTRADGERGRGSTIIQDDADVSMLLSEWLPKRRGVKGVRIELIKDKLIPTAATVWHFTVTTTGTPQTLEARTTFSLVPVVEDSDSVKDAKLEDRIQRYVWERRHDGGVSRTEMEKGKDKGGLGAKATDLRRVLNRMLCLDAEFIDEGLVPKLYVEKKKLFCINPPALAPTDNLLTRALKKAPVEAAS